MSRPSINERHVGRTHRSIFLRAQDWTVQASGGTIANGYITLAAGEDVGCCFVPPYDLDPSFPLKFRFIYSPNVAARQSRSTVVVTFSGAGTIATGAVLTFGGVSYTLDLGQEAGGAAPYNLAVTAVNLGAGHDLTPGDVMALAVPNAAIESCVAGALTQAGVDEAVGELILYANLTNNDGTDVGYTFDRSTSTPLTTPIGSFTPLSTTNLQQSPVGSLTLPSTTRRDWSAGLYLVGSGAGTIYVMGVEIAYVPLIAGVTGAASEIADAWSV